ncbi:MAG: N-acetyltransferase family protein [Candidatus Nanohaloarchaea archaeon]
MMNYELRIAEPDDLEIIKDLSVKLSEKEAEEFDSTIDPEWNNTDEAEEYFQQRINENSGFAFVVEDNQEVVGYAVGGIRDAESYREDLRIAELETMYVEPDYRREGIRTEFVNEFQRWAEEKDADRMRVEVTSQNEKGISFYENQGLEDYARIMEKDLY